MISHRKRLENLEAVIAPRKGKPFIVWGMDDDFMRLKTEQELDGEIADAIATGRMAANDEPIVVVWKRNRHKELPA
jgi:hypothetical protein